MKVFGVDLTKLKERSEHVTTFKNAKCTVFSVFASRGLGSIPFPIGCSAIATPSKLATDGYWFAGVFGRPEPLIQPEPRKLYMCMTGFLPLLMKSRMTFESASFKCFQVDGAGYKLSIPMCILRRGVNHQDFFESRKSLADLFPNNPRFRHGALKVQNLENMKKHPAFWSRLQDLNFIVLLISREAEQRLLELPSLVIGGNWASDPEVAKDVRGDRKYWPRGGHSRYNTTSLIDLGRYYRNKAVHFEQLHPDLKNALGKSTDKLVELCNRWVTSGDLVFSLWEAANGKLESMEEFWTDDQIQH